MTDAQPPPIARSIATLGMAVCGPVTFLSGIGVFGTIMAGPPVWLVAVFLLAAAGTVVSTLLYIASDMAERGAD